MSKKQINLSKGKDQSSQERDNKSTLAYNQLTLENITKTIGLSELRALNIEELAKKINRDSSEALKVLAEILASDLLSNFHYLSLSEKNKLSKDYTDEFLKIGFKTVQRLMRPSRSVRQYDDPFSNALRYIASGDFLFDALIGVSQQVAKTFAEQFRVYSTRDLMRLTDIDKEAIKIGMPELDFDTVLKNAHFFQRRVERAKEQALKTYQHLVRAVGVTSIRLHDLDTIRVLLQRNDLGDMSIIKRLIAKNEFGLIYPEHMSDVVVRFLVEKIKIFKLNDLDNERTKRRMIRKLTKIDDDSASELKRFKETVGDDISNLEQAIQRVKNCELLAKLLKNEENAGQLIEALQIICIYTPNDLMMLTESELKLAYFYAKTKNSSGKEEVDALTLSGDLVEKIMKLKVQLVTSTQLWESVTTALPKTMGLLEESGLGLSQLVGLEEKKLSRVIDKALKSVPNPVKFELKAFTDRIRDRKIKLPSGIGSDLPERFDELLEEKDDTKFKKLVALVVNAQLMMSIHEVREINNIHALISSDTEVNYCECDWDDSIFSMKAYLHYLLYFYSNVSGRPFTGNLIDYLDREFDMSSLITSDGVDIGIYGEETLISAIVLVQERIRKNIDQQMLEIKVENSMFRMLTYTQWKQYMFNKYFPDNNFEFYLTSLRVPSFSGNRGIDEEQQDLNEQIDKMEVSVEIGPPAVSYHTTVFIAGNTANLDVLKVKRLGTSELISFKDHIRNMFSGLSDLYRLYHRITDVAVAGFRRGNWDVARDLIYGADELPSISELLERINLAYHLNHIVLGYFTPMHNFLRIFEVFRGIRNFGESYYSEYKQHLFSLDFGESFRNRLLDIVDSIFLVDGLSYHPPLFYQLGSFPSTNKDYFGSRIEYALTGFGTGENVNELRGFTVNHYVHSGDEYFLSRRSLRNSEEHWFDFDFDFSELVYDSTWGGWPNDSSDYRDATPILKDGRFSIKIKNADRRIEFMQKPELLFRFLYHLPYIYYFVLPLINAKYEQSQNNFDSAIVWLSLILDFFAEDTPTFITPFDLMGSEKRLVLRILGEILLEHAEVLYRENTKESIQEAKEKYIKILAIFSNYHCEGDFEIDVVYRAMSQIMQNTSIPLVLRSAFCQHAEKMTSMDMRRSDFVELVSSASTEKMPQNFEGLLQEFAEKQKKIILNRQIKAVSKETFKAPSSSPLHSRMYFFTQSGDQIFFNEVLDALVAYSALAELNFEQYDEYEVQNFLLEGFCIYPNPRIMTIVKAAAKYLEQILDNRNFIGYKLIDISIYTYEELFKKTVWYVNLALQLEHAYIGYVEAYEVEEEKKWGAMMQSFKALQAVLLDQAQLNLGSLMITEAKQNVELSALQIARAQQVIENINQNLDVLEDEAWARGLATGGISVIMGAIAGGVVGGVAGAGIGAVPGAILGALGSGGFQQAASAYLDYIAQKRHLEQDLQVAKIERKIADQRYSLSLTGVSIAEAQQTINQLSHNLDTAYLQLSYQFERFLTNQELSAEAYFYMLHRAKNMYKTYMDMAIRFAWLAERKLAFSRSSRLETIRFNYHLNPRHDKKRGLLLAAEALQKDVNSLNFYKELSEQNRVELKKTFSLRLLDPVGFANLMTSGVMTFRTSADFFKFRMFQMMEAGYREMGSFDELVDGRTIDDVVFVYDGHSRYPDYLGHLQHRIRSVEFRLIGLIGQQQDIQVSLSNIGSSMVMIKNNGPSSFVTRNDNYDRLFIPHFLRHYFQRVTFNRAEGQNTEREYVYTAKDGILNPFESIGLDTTWELRVDPVTNAFDLSTIYDIQMVVDYSAEYSERYKSLQLSTLFTDSTFTTLWEPLHSVRAFSFKHLLPDVFYRLQNADKANPEFRDMRIVTFTTDNKYFGVNETGKQITFLSVYISLKENLGQVNAPHLRIGVVEDKKVRRQTFASYRSVVAQLETDADMSGFIDYSHKENLNASTRPLRKIIEADRSVQRKWSFKFFGGVATPPSYLKTDITGTPLNVDGTVGQQTDVLQGKAAAQGQDQEAVLTIPSFEHYRDSYSLQLKFKMISGTAEIALPIHDKKYTLQLVKNVHQEGIDIVSQVQTPQITITSAFGDNEWYQIECVSIIKPGNQEFFFRLQLDGQVIYEDSLPLPADNAENNLKLTVKADSEIFIDDLILRTVNRSGVASRTFYVDAFKSKNAQWDNAVVVAGQYPGPLVEGFRIAKGENPALDLSVIDDVILMMQYDAQPKNQMKI